MWILLIITVSTLLAINVKTKELACVKTEKPDSAEDIVTYQTIPGKKGANGIKGLRGEPGGITKQDLDKLESKI